GGDGTRDSLSRDIPLRRRAALEPWVGRRVDLSPEPRGRHVAQCRAGHRDHADVCGNKPRGVAIQPERDPQRRGPSALPSGRRRIADPRIPPCSGGHAARAARRTDRPAQRRRAFHRGRTVRRRGAVPDCGRRIAPRADASPRRIAGPRGQDPTPRRRSARPPGDGRAGPREGPRIVQHRAGYRPNRGGLPRRPGRRARRYGMTRRVVLCPLFVHAAHVSSSYGYPTMRWIPPNLLNRARSSSDGSYTPLGWEWTVPTTEKSAGRVWSWKIAWCLPLIVPGTRRSSSIVPWSARKIAPNSRGYMSREASRIMRR